MAETWLVWAVHEGKHGSMHPTLPVTASPGPPALQHAPFTGEGKPLCTHNPPSFPSPGHF